MLSEDRLGNPESTHFNRDVPRSLVNPKIFHTALLVVAGGEMTLVMHRHKCIQITVRPKNRGVNHPDEIHQIRFGEL
jgi:hypothetical protein